MAPRAGLEPAAQRLTAVCSTYWANEEYIIQANFFTHGTHIPKPMYNLSRRNIYICPYASQAIMGKNRGVKRFSY